MSGILQTINILCIILYGTYISTLYLTLLPVFISGKKSWDHKLDMAAEKVIPVSVNVKELPYTEWI